jgi:dihydroorotase
MPASHDSLSGGRDEPFRTVARRCSLGSEIGTISLRSNAYPATDIRATVAFPSAGPTPGPESMPAPKHPKQSQPRRDFLRHTVVGTSLICSLAQGWQQLLGWAKPAPARFDLVIKGGKVVDPSQQLSAPRDVGIRDGKIAEVTEIAETEARQVLDARGKIVTPGLIDVHVHVYDGVAPLGIPADPNCIAKGVTTVVDAGSSGAHTFPGFRRQVINVVDTRVFALLNISVVGQSTLSQDNPYGELLDLRYANPKLAIRTIEQNRDVVLGVKVRLSRSIAGDHDLEALKLAKEAAEAVRLPLMVHIGETHTPLPTILSLLAKGDVVTHSFRGGEGGILDDKGRVLNEVRGAVARGVHLDIGHGAGSFSFDTAERALKQDVVPGTISSDVHQFNVNGPVFDLATTLSKFLHLGLTLEQVIERASTNAANLFAFPKGLGTLRPGAEADVAVFSLLEGDFEFVDALQQRRLGHQKLSPVATVKAGRIYGSAPLPVARLG